MTQTATSSRRAGITDSVSSLMASRAAPPFSAFEAEPLSVRAARDCIVFKCSDYPIALNFISDITTCECSRRLLYLCDITTFT